MQAGRDMGANMSSPEMLVLLEEAAQSSTDLATRAIAGATAAGEVADQAQALGLKAVNEAERLHRAYVETVAAIKHAAEEAARAGEATAHTLESVSAESAKTAGGLKDMLLKVEGEAFHFGEERTRLFHALDDSAHEAETGFHDLAAKVAAFEEHITSRIEESQEALKHVQDMVRQVATRMAETQRSLNDQLDELGCSGVETMGYVVNALDQPLSAIAGGLVTFANEGIIGHNGVVAAVRQAYLDESKDDPEPEHTYREASFGTLREAVSRFGQLSEPAQSSLHSPTT